MLVFGSHEKVKRKVELNIYDLNPSDGKQVITGLNAYTKSLGVGAFHSSIAIEGVGEYAYGRGETGSGVFHCQVRQCMPDHYKYRETFPLGDVELSVGDVHQILQSFIKSPEWQACNYDLTRRNCNHFSNALSIALCGREIPAWVNRGADGLDKIRIGYEYTSNKLSEISNSEQVQSVKKVAAETATSAMKNVKVFANSEPVQNAKKVATETASSLFDMVSRGVASLLTPAPASSEERKSVSEDEKKARAANCTAVQAKP